MIPNSATRGGFLLKLWVSISNFFNSSDATVALPGDPFLVIDRDRAVERLQLDRRALENGTRGRIQDSTALDDVEREIIAEITDYSSRAQIDAMGQYKLYEQRLSELFLLGDLSMINGAVEQALGDMRSTIIDRMGRLALARDAIGESYGEMANFKKVNGLNRPAQDGITTTYAWSIILISWLIESIANTFFLRVDDDLGFLGGFIAAIVVASVNVFTSMACGRLVFPYLRHNEAFVRIISYLTLSAWISGTLVWNFLAAHFRDAKSAGLSIPERASLELFVSHPFSLETIYSYGLLMAGFLFAGTSALTAFRMDDPYPGYGPIYRRHEVRCQEYADLVGEAIADLQAIRDRAIESAQRTRDHLRAQYSERGQILSSRDALRTRYQEYQEYLETQANFLLDYYRSARARAAKEADVTPIASVPRWSLPRTHLPKISKPKDIERDVIRAQETLDSLIDSVSNAYLSAIGSIQHLDDIKRLIHAT